MQRRERIEMRGTQANRRCSESPSNTAHCRGSGVFVQVMRCIFSQRENEKDIRSYPSSQAFGSASETTAARRRARLELPHPCRSLRQHHLQRGFNCVCNAKCVSVKNTRMVIILSVVAVALHPIKHKSASTKNHVEFNRGKTNLLCD